MLQPPKQKIIIIGKFTSSVTIRTQLDTQYYETFHSKSHIHPLHAHESHIHMKKKYLCTKQYYSYSDDDSESPQKIHSEMSLTELNQSLRMSLPRPKSGEFLKLFEGNSPQSSTLWNCSNLQATSEICIKNLYMTRYCYASYSYGIFYTFVPSDFFLCVDMMT